MLLIVWCLLAAPAAAQTEPAAPPAPAAAAAESPTPPADEGAIDEASRRVRRMADELRSPFCPGKTLMTCTSSNAYDLRKEMLNMVNEGYADDEIMRLLIERYGDQISNPPQPWYTFFVPFLPFLVLAGLLFWLVRRWRNRGVAEAPAPTLPEAGADADRLARLRARVREDVDL
ncbi:MAG: cytochrome c-type biogenesis protein CcmH [Myxococcales bacterium]|nr:cytochrome c-type biogenesis protein CcmH [Myxococcales bacterium]